MLLSILQHQMEVLYLTNTIMTKNCASGSTPHPVSLTHIEQVRDCSSDFRLAISFLKRFFSILPVRSHTVLIVLLLGVAAFSSIPQSAAGVQMIVSKSSVDTREGFKPTLDVELSEEPSADVVVTATSGDIDKLTVSPASLTIKPGQHPEGEDNDPLRTGICYFSPPPPPPNCPPDDPACKADHSCYFEITLRQDPDSDDNTITITLSAMEDMSSLELDNKTVTVSVLDDDGDLMLELPQDPVMVTEGSTADFNVYPDFQPPRGKEITVIVSSPDTDAVTVMPTSFTFTHGNFFERHTVTVRGKQDDNTDDERVTLTLGDSDMGVTAGTVIVEVDDDDLGLILSQTPVTVTEGEEVDFDVELNFEPPGDVAVDVVSEDTGAVTVMPESLEFTPDNWNTQQLVTVMGIQDPDANDETVMLRLSGNGVTTRMVTVEVSDNTIITRGPVVNLPGAPLVPCDTPDNESSIEEEREALAQLYGTTGGENWDDGDNWDTSEPVETWYGVITNNAGRVTELRLGDNGLAGELPDELENLDCLENLDVSDNSDLEGELPLGLMGLSKLMTLHINGTDLCAPEETDFLEWLRGIKTFPENVDVCVADEEEEISGDDSAGGGCAVVSYARTGNGGMNAAFGLFLTALVLLAAVSPKRRPGAGTAGFQPGIGQQ